MYTIYHIPGVKIGCTEQNPQERIKVQGFTEFEILEVHEDIYIASNREIELQKEYELPVDPRPYWKVRQMQTYESSAKGGKTQGKKNIETNHMEYMRSKANFSEAGKIGGRKNIESGHMSRLHKANKNNHNSPQRLKVTCPYCGKIGQHLAMGRWHGDNCKSKK